MFIMYLVGYADGKCSWNSLIWPPGWPVHIQFQDPNKLRKDQLIQIIDSIKEGTFITLNKFKFDVFVSSKITCFSLF